MTCTCLLKHQNGGVCTCSLSLEDAMEVLGINQDEVSLWEEEDEKKQDEDSTKITKPKDDWFVQ